MCARYPGAQPRRRGVALGDAAAGFAIIEVGGKPCLALDGGDTAGEAAFQIGLQRLRRKVHGQVELISRARGVANLGHAFGNKSALPHARFSEAATPGFGVGARNRREIDVEVPLTVRAIG